MQKFVIERDMPGVGKLTPGDLKDAARKSNEVLQQLGPKVQWVQSYVTDDKIYCVYIADSENSVREHAQKSGFPANRVSKVSAMLDAASAG